MKNLPSFGSFDGQDAPLRFTRERLFAYVRARPVLLYPLRVLRSVLYLALVFLRVPVQLVCRFAIVPLFLLALVWGFISGWTSMPVRVLGGGSLALFLFSYLFDTVLLKLAPRREQIYLGM